MGRREALFIIRLIPFLTLFVYVDQAAGSASGLAPREQAMTLPKQVGQWKLVEGPRRIEPKAIFDYMDGGGELYLGYRFRYLDVFNYAGAGDEQILVEVYRMEGSDDAFGLLSLDRDGEAIGFGRGESGQGIYGAGLLRLWSGDIYARVLAERETPQSRQAVMALGESVCRGRRQTAQPAFLKALPAALSGFRLEPNRVSYFRSYLVLNSLYFLSNENILKLGLKTEAAIASYVSGSGGQQKRARLLEIRYESDSSALSAYRSFLAAYFPETKSPKAGSGQVAKATPPAGKGGTRKVEDGWAGHRLVGRSLVLAFEFPSEPTARLCLDTATEQLQNWEKSHE
ncbi:MAG: hypothetical protein EHM61_19530 [Acidobacteria bacterium]|nr:MAG: hypothetical protein EHM61_19530 [Acidobacteriota bacterium]